MTTLLPKHRLRRFHHIRTRLQDARMKREPDRGLPRWLPWAIVVVMLAALAAGFLVTTASVTAESDKQVVTEQRDATADQALRAALPVLALCKEQSPVGEALRAAPDDPCAQAAQVQADPVPLQGPQGEQGPGPSAEQIALAVATYLVQNPPPAGRGPNVAEITAAVASFLTANPPEPGRPPTAAEIALAVAGWFADHPVRDGVDGVNGRDGDTGEPGRPPTAEEIQAAVAAELAANPPPAGPEGPSGPTCPAGTTLQQVEYADQQVGQGCVFDVQPPAPTLPLMGN